MPEEQAVASPEASPVTADNHKRKLEDLELNSTTEPPAVSDPHSDTNGAQEEGNGGADESEAKRQRLDTNDDNVTEEELVPQNGHQEDEGEDDPKLEEPELVKPADDNVLLPEVVQEPVNEHVEAANEKLASNEIDKAETGSGVEPGKPDVEFEKPSEEVPREGDVPVPSSERQADSVSQVLSRQMEVPNDKVGVLIGKSGDTIRNLQDNSGAKIQIMRDADTDPRAPTRPLELVGTLESINKAEKLIKDVIAEADAGGSPSLVARGFNTAQAASGGEQLELQVPIEKVGLIIGKGGETIRSMQTRSGARIQLIQQNPADGEQTRERIVRVTGNNKQIEIAREMIKDVMNQIARPSPLSGGYNQQGYRPRGPGGQQWGSRGPHHAQFSGYDYQQRGPYPSPNSQYPPPSYGNYPPPQGPRGHFGPSWEQQRPPQSFHGPSSQGNYNYGQQQGPDYGHPPPYSQAPAQPYGHGYNEVKYDHHVPSQHYGHMGSQPAPYAHGGSHSGYGQQDQYGKPPMYGMQPQVPHAQPYGQPRPNQPGEVPYQGPGSSAQAYGRNVPPQQQSYPYVSSGAMQQSYPPYGPAPAADGYGHTSAVAPASGYGPQGGQPVAGYGQTPTQQPPSYTQAGQAGGYGSYPQTHPGYPEQPAADSSAYGYQAPAADPAAYATAQAPAAYNASAQTGYAQPSQTQPAYDQAAGYGNVPVPGAGPVPGPGPAAGGYGKSASPQPAAYPQYDSSQVYGGHR